MASSSAVDAGRQRGARQAQTGGAGHRPPMAIGGIEQDRDDGQVHRLARLRNG
ncbi:MAG: hypothetical protein Q8M01_10365 [Rubrivivax sp.]|nr:hypothetical protein [Rubrivivax sp.]